MPKCKVCGKEFKKLTASHLKSHGLTFDEYLEKYEKEKYVDKELIKFLNDFYIKVRWKFLEYSNNRTFTNGKNKRGWGLTDSDLKDHLRGSRTIGVYFLKECCDLIGFDIDVNHENEKISKEEALLISKDNLRNLYNTLINYGISKNNILISFSGNKGYHVDIFLSDNLPKVVINKFYEVILSDLRVSKQRIELFGGRNNPYKLPLGYHIKTNNYCYVSDEEGMEIKNFKDKLKSIERLDTSTIGDIVDMNYIDYPDSKLIAEFEELESTVDIEEITGKFNSQVISNIEKLLQEGKTITKGIRQNSIFKVARYCRDIKFFSLNETMQFISDWVNTSWNKSIIDDEVRGHIINTSTSVYKYGYKLIKNSSEICFTLPEVSEIFSLKTNNKLQTEALRKLYYIFFIFSKMLANSEGIFYKSYNDLIEAGANKNTSELIKQVNKLEELGKIYIIERGMYKKPNKYKLAKSISFNNNLPQFKLCDEKIRCKDCLKINFCYLATEKERRKYIKGAEYKKLRECPYNK